MAGIVLAGCATNRLHPNRNLDSGEVVISGSVNAPGLLGVSRLGASVREGAGWGDFGADVGIGGAGFEMGAAGRAYLGPVNAGLRLGLLVGAWDGGDFDPTPAGAWELRLTTRSAPVLPVYAGLMSSGAVMNDEARGFLGAVLGAEWWWKDLGLQLELGVSPLQFGSGGVELTHGYGACSDVCVPTGFLVAQLGLAVHFGVVGPN